ncbi:hypothetical protein LTR97_006308 [Elasticomyces elasticus]|uniref:Heterokaryon incompatibility domain-containing protein n=1 Tax=Elasticomyces elasticus TaxID=574655 RepID=A0AAN8A0Q6_9PEZI|nr:hypothetical protein LTR97_006308 [Elasticomyces elasticus]
MAVAPPSLPTAESITRTHVVLSLGQYYMRRCEDPKRETLKASDGCSSNSHDGILNSYEYVHLKDHEEIRILRLLSVSGDTIQCTLENVSIGHLHTAHGYYALSYCWGSSYADKEILVDGCVFMVTPTLLAALKAVWRYMKHDGRSVNGIWIDAICIAQAQSKEKSVQVHRMHQVYRNASEVLVWLGDEADGSQRVMLLVQWLNASRSLAKRRSLASDRRTRSRMQQLEERLKTLYDIATDVLVALEEVLTTFNLHEASGEFGYKDIVQPLPTLHDAQRTLFASFPADHSIWSDCDKLMDRDWFSRVWTYQEIKLARNATVLCGEEYANWQAIQSWRVQCFARFRSVGVPPWIFAAFVRYHFPMLHGSAQSQKPATARTSVGTQSLPSLLLQMGARRACDKRDYVFGCLALLDRKISSAISVDYEISPSTVYKSAMRLACSLSGGVDFWCHVVEVFAESTSSGSTSDLPSWCPDLSRMAQHILGWPFQPPEPLSDVVRRAVNPMKSLAFVSCDKVRVAGVVLDEVEESATLAAYASTTKDHTSSKNMACSYFNDHYEQWRDEMAALFPPRNNIQQRWEEGYFYADLHVASSDQKRKCAEYRLACRHVRSKHVKSMLAVSGAANADASEDVYDSMLSNVVGYSMNNGRFFFRSKAGRIGYSPQPTRPGDQICFVGGGNYLHVLSAGLSSWVTYASLEGLDNQKILQMVLTRPWHHFELV